MFVKIFICLLLFLNFIIISISEPCILYPDYGPITGETVITIVDPTCLTNVNISKNIHLLLGNQFRCENVLSQYILKRDGTYFNNPFNWMTPVVKDSYLNTPLNVSWCVDSQCFLLNGTSFTPKIKPIMNYEKPVVPSKTILSGGLQQTFKGSNFDSVDAPYLNFIIYRNGIVYKENVFVDSYNSITNKQNTVCKASNDTLICHTPKLSVVYPEDFTDPIYEIYMQLSLNVISKSEWNGNRQYYKISVFKDPSFNEFEPRIKEYSPTDIQNKKSIIITGTKLLEGCNASDYQVSVGGVPVVPSVQNNVIGFLPPAVEPLESSTDNQGGKQVKVVVGNLDYVIGYLKYHQEDTFPYYWIGVGVGAFIFICLVVGGIYFCIKYSKSRQSGNGSPVESHIYVDPEHHEPSHIYIPLPPELEDKKIEFEQLKIEKKELSKGHFGKVLKGEYNDKTVAIKTLLDKFYSNPTEKMQTVQEFYKEALLMKDIDHPNVVHLIGVAVTSSSIPFIVLPFMANGDLKKFLKTYKDLALENLLKFALDVLKGMEYLSDKGIVHRDLAARNCMVSEDLTVSVSDFGLSRQTQDDSEYYKQVTNNAELPFRWLALECYTEQNKKFSEKSDIWSFGVLMWEILTLGGAPFGYLSIFELFDHLKEGGRLENPGTDDFIYETFMTQCWLKEPSDRPKFSELRTKMEKFLSIESNQYLIPKN